MSFHDDMEIHKRRIAMLEAAHDRYNRPTRINAVAAVLCILGFLSSGTISAVVTLVGFAVLALAVVDLVCAFRFNLKTKRELPPLPRDSMP